MVISFKVTIGLEGPVLSLVQGISTKLDLIIANQEKTMASIDDVISDIADETSTIAGLSTFIQGLKDAIAAQGLSPDVQAKIDRVFASVEANKATLAAALSANVPPPPAAA
jgi:uncharacterized coiled-coil protein SlyX